jgi:hypothetical protein
LIEDTTCPYCKTPMEDGYIAGSYAIWWTKKRPRFVLNKRGGNIELAQSFDGWAARGASRCPICKVIIVK